MAYRVSVSKALAGFFSVRDCWVEEAIVSHCARGQKAFRAGPDGEHSGFGSKQGAGEMGKGPLSMLFMEHDSPICCCEA